VPRESYGGAPQGIAKIGVSIVVVLESGDKIGWSHSRRKHDIQDWSTRSLLLIGIRMGQSGRPAEFVAMTFDERRLFGGVP
jgi:hypothetical protein